jgi:hypothetical protein
MSELISRLYNTIHVSMVEYGLAELLMRVTPTAIFQEKADLCNILTMRKQKDMRISEAFREALHEAYVKLKLEKMGVMETSRKGQRRLEEVEEGGVEGERNNVKKQEEESIYQKLIKFTSPEYWEEKKNVTLYMNFGLLEGKGYKVFDATASPGQAKAGGFELLLAALGRIYYSVIHRREDDKVKVMYLAFIPSSRLISGSKLDLELALHVRGLVARFEAGEFERTTFMERFSDIPDIAKPLVLSLFLDQNALRLAWERKFRSNPISLSWVVLEGGRNFRENVLIPLDKSMNAVIALGEYQKPVRNLVQSIIKYRPRGGSLPRESIEWLSRIAYAFMNRDPEELAKVNLEVLRARDEEGGEGLWPLRQKELLKVCEIIESM